MKRFVLSICFVFFLFLAVHTLGQESICEVKVFSEKEPLEYVYVFINGKYYGVTDSLGQISISGKDLRSGDTLSISYVGIKPDMQIYNGKNECIFNLSPVFELNEVTKIASIKAFYKFYKENVIVRIPQVKEYRFNYLSKFYENKTDRVLQEGFLHISDMVYLGDSLSYKLKKINIASGDSSAVNFACIVRDFMEEVYLLYNFSRAKDYLKDFKLKYLGENEKDKIFIWDYLNSRSEKLRTQIIIYADKKTKLINKTEVNYIHPVTYKLIKRFFEYEYNKKKKSYFSMGKIYSFYGASETDKRIITVLKNTER